MWDDLTDECFFIAPIGEENSPQRERSDGVRDFIVKPAALEAQLADVIRADDIAEPGQITLQVIEHVLRAKAAVVDLTGANPNVYYEMAIRHTARLPTVLIADEAERGNLPFDLQGMRTIFFSDSSLKSADACRRELAKQLLAALSGAVDSPVVASVNLENLESGDAQGQILASLVNTVDALAREIRSNSNRPRATASPPLSTQARAQEPLLTLMFEAWLVGEEGFTGVRTQVRTADASYDLIAESKDSILLAELSLDSSRIRETAIDQLLLLPVPEGLQGRRLRRALVVSSSAKVTIAAARRAKDAEVEIYEVEDMGDVVRIA